MGTSSPSSFFWVGMVAYEMLEEKAYKIFFLLKPWLLKVGASTMACLIFLNSSFISWFYINTMYFLIIPCKFFIISTNTKMNLQIKFIFPTKRCMTFMLFGYVIVVIDLVLLGPISISYLYRSNPKIFLSITTNILLFGFNKILYLWHLSKIWQKLVRWFTSIVRKHCYIIQVYHH